MCGRPSRRARYAALAGATVLVNLSASNITIGKAEYRRNLCASQSGKCIAAYLYSCAGPGESTTDLAWDGHALIYENGDLLAESERFADREQMITADIDLERLVQDRMRMTSFSDSVGDCRERLQAMRRVPFEFRVPAGKVALQRHDRALPLRAERPARAGPALLRGLQHPGAQPAQAAGQHRDQAGGHRHLRRAGLDARADRRRQDDGPDGPAAEEHPGLHDAGLCHEQAHARPTRTS